MVNQSVTLHHLFSGSKWISDKEGEMSFAKDLCCSIFSLSARTLSHPSKCYGIQSGSSGLRLFIFFRFYVSTSQIVYVYANTWSAQPTTILKLHFVILVERGQPHKICIDRESNPGLPRGRREFYHWTINAFIFKWRCQLGLNQGLIYRSFKPK